MPETSESWLSKAQGNLRRAKTAYADEEYWDVVSHLQQADEKIGKAVLLATGLLPDSQHMREIMTSVFGVEKTTPEKLGHNWHINLIGDFAPFLDSFEGITGSLEGGKSESMKAAAKWWKDSIPDYKERVKKASAVKANPLPSMEELDATIKDCNKALDLAAALPATLKLPEVNVPNTEDIFVSLDKSLRAFGIKVDKKTRKNAEEKALSKLPNLTKDFNAMFVKAAQSSYLLIALMVLNVHLQQHHTLANYPTKKVVYDKKLPLIARFEELRMLLQRSHDMAKLLA
jgi:hypothetical protein